MPPNPAFIFYLNIGPRTLFNNRCYHMPSQTLSLEFIDKHKNNQTQQNKSIYTYKSSTYSPLAFIYIHVHVYVYICLYLSPSDLYCCLLLSPFFFTPTSQGTWAPSGVCSRFLHTRESLLATVAPCLFWRDQFIFFSLIGQSALRGLDVLVLHK